MNLLIQIPDIMESFSQILARGTTPDWFYLKSYCKSLKISYKISLFFEDDWISIQQVHLNKAAAEITFIFYHEGQKYTNLTLSVPKTSPKTPPVKSFLSNYQHKKFIEWEISFGGSIERVLLELDFKSCPRTSENFWQICTDHPSLSYVNSNFHRSVKSCFIEGGIIESDAKSIYGDYFPDENFSYKHSEAGVIGMVKSTSGMNGTRFYITLRPVNYFNGKLVAFGRVVEGMKVIRKIAKLPTSNQIIVDKVVITKSQEFLTKKDNIEDMRRTGGFESLSKKKSNCFRELANELLKFV